MTIITIRVLDSSQADRILDELKRSEDEGIIDFPFTSTHQEYYEQGQHTTNVFMGNSGTDLDDAEGQPSSTD